MNFEVNVQVDARKVAGLLCSAFEGGSSYWYEIQKFVAPKRMTFYSSPDLGRHDSEPPAIYKHIDYPLNQGGAIVVTSKEDKEIDGVSKWRLNLKSINKGLHVMAEDYADHFANMVRDDADATTGDVFLQCCLFGKVIYG